MPTAVPPVAAAIVDLLNSRPHATPLLPDALETTTTAAEILRPFAALATGARLADQVAPARVLRADLMAAITATDASDAWASFTEHTADAVFRHTFPAADLDQVAGDPVVGGITRAVAELLATNTWSRIRACDNELCEHAFYDTTRSRTQRWHSYEICGNRINVAAYRARSAKD